MTQQAESSGWDVATKLEHSHGGVPCVATAEIRRLQAENEALRTALAQQDGTFINEGTKTKPVAYLTKEGDMVWTPEMYGEACTYCADGEFPIPLYTAASPEVIPVQPNIKNQIFTDISAPQPAQAEWRDMVTVTLMREGVGKHRARELADHFFARAVLAKARTK